MGQIGLEVVDFWGHPQRCSWLLCINSKLIGWFLMRCSRGALSIGSFTQMRCCLPTTGKASLSAQAAASIVPAWEKSTVKQPIWPPRNESMGLLGIRQTFNRKTRGNACAVNHVSRRYFHIFFPKYVSKQYWDSFFVSPQAVFSCWATVVEVCNIHLWCVTWDAKASWTHEVILQRTVDFVISFIGIAWRRDHFTAYYG